MTTVIYSVFCVYFLEPYIANNMDQDQTAPKEAVWSGSIIFAFKIETSLPWIVFENMQQT